MEYSYKCNLCGRSFNLLQSMKDDSIHFHYENNKSKCFGEVVRIITGGTGIIFKGKGWTPKFGSKTGKKTSKIDDALNQMGVVDESEGWTRKD